MSFMAQTGRTRMQRDVFRLKQKEIKKKNVKRKKELIKERDKKITELKRIQESLRDITIKQPSPKKTKIKKKSVQSPKTRRLIERARKQTRALERSGAELRKLDIKADIISKNKYIDLFNEKQRNRILDSTNLSMSKIVSQFLIVQQKNGKDLVCRGSPSLSDLAQSNSSVNNSLTIMGDNETIWGILTYINNNEVKIPFLCSKAGTRGIGTRLMKKIELKFRGKKDIIVDSVPSAIGFYKKLGFVIEGESQGTIQMRKKSTKT